MVLFCVEDRNANGIWFKKRRKLAFGTSRRGLNNRSNSDYHLNHTVIFEFTKRLPDRTRSTKSTFTVYGALQIKLVTIFTLNIDQRNASSLLVSKPFRLRSKEYKYCSPSECDVYTVHWHLKLYGNSENIRKRELLFFEIKNET